jgi:hypothetical protein
MADDRQRDDRQSIKGHPELPRPVLMISFQSIKSGGEPRALQTLRDCFAGGAGASVLGYASTQELPFEKPSFQLAS